MFDFFSPDAFAKAFSPAQGFDAEAIRKASYEHGLKVLELQQAVAQTQLEQARAFAELSRQQTESMAALQADAMRQGVTAMLDAQKSALELFKPAEA